MHRFAFALPFFISAAVGENISFDGLFRDRAILQSEADVRVWGTSKENEVTLSLDNKVVATVPSNAGTWVAYLPKQPTGWNRVLKAEDAGGVATVNVDFGAVLLCGGQSNMQMPLVGNEGNFGFESRNGTAEAAAGAKRYAGKIKLLTAQMIRWKSWNGTTCTDRQANNGHCTFDLRWNDLTTETLSEFSALCWYTGKQLFERSGGKFPVGLMKAAYSGSSIVNWLPPGQAVSCGGDKMHCGIDGFKPSDFYTAYVKPLAPYTIGAVVWDQGEKDVHCSATYPCMTKQLIKSWRKEFNSTFVFVAVQLPGYYHDCDGLLHKDYGYKECVPGIFNMRLAQEEGTFGEDLAATVPTYDLGCPRGGDETSTMCPFGSVHNAYKPPIAMRIAGELLHFWRDPKSIVEGPRVQSVTAAPLNANETTVTVKFSGGAEPFYMNETENCALCCSSGVGDFDASSDGITWENATSMPTLERTSVKFTVSLPRVTHVRYTANQAFPQCAIYNQQGMPAWPFAMPVDSDVRIGRPGFLAIANPHLPVSGR